MSDGGTSSDGNFLARLYARRFEGAAASRQAIWEVLCRHFFQRWIARDALVVDVAAGHCEFINAIEAGRKVALDLNPETASLAAPGVDVRITGATEVARLGLPPVDVVFASNLLEHLERPVIVDLVRQVHAALRPGGRFLILQPNIRFAAKDYWMFFDHVTPIDDRALVELLESEGFGMETVIPRFLPYTTRSALPQAPWLVRLYLAVPLAWRVLGGQAFLVAKRRDAA